MILGPEPAQGFVLFDRRQADKNRDAIAEQHRIAIADTERRAALC